MSVSSMIEVAVYAYVKKTFYSLSAADRCSTVFRILSALTALVAQTFRSVTESIPRNRDIDRDDYKFV